jgi:hypothetical protein
MRDILKPTLSELRDQAKDVVLDALNDFWQLERDSFKFRVVRNKFIFSASDKGYSASDVASMVCLEMEEDPILSKYANVVCQGNTIQIFLPLLRSAKKYV